MASGQGRKHAGEALEVLQLQLQLQRRYDRHPWITRTSSISLSIDVSLQST